MPRAALRITFSVAHNLRRCAYPLETDWHGDRAPSGEKNLRSRSHASIVKSSPREVTTWALVSRSQAMGSSSSASTGFAAASSLV